MSKFESSYVLSKTRQNKIISDYFENNGADGLFQFTRIGDLRTYIFWRDYKDQKLFTYEWLPVESKNVPLLSNMIKSSIAGVILSFFIVAIVIAMQTEKDKHK